MAQSLIIFAFYDLNTTLCMWPPIYRKWLTEIMEISGKNNQTEILKYQIKKIIHQNDLELFKDTRQVVSIF